MVYEDKVLLCTNIILNAWKLKYKRSYSLFVTHMTGIEEGIKNRWKLFPYEHIEFP